MQIVLPDAFLFPLYEWKCC